MPPADASALVPLARAFGLDAPTGAGADEAALRAWLTEVVARMLASERDRLLAVLYRVDVPAALADALLARMAEKPRFRRPPP